MIIFNFIGLIFVGVGVAVSLVAGLVFHAYMGTSIEAPFVVSTWIGLWTMSVLDLRYRWIGETPGVEVAHGTTPPPPAGVMGLVGGFFQLAWNLLWPFSGGQILFVPVWLPAPALFLLSQLGYFGASAPPPTTI